MSFDPKYPGREVCDRCPIEKNQPTYFLPCPKHSKPTHEIGWEERVLCDKCGGPFQEHHWRHYSPREKKVYHTGCFEQSKFPSLLTHQKESIVSKLEGKAIWLNSRGKAHVVLLKDAIEVIRGE